MTLIQTLAHPINGYWDGGPKQTFEWFILDRQQKDKQGRFVKIGSWSANYWFHVALGKTEKLTFSYAKKHLQATTKIPSTFKYKE